MIDDMMKPGFSPRFVSIEEPVDPSIYTGFVGHWSGGAVSPVDTAISDDAMSARFFDACMNSDSFSFVQPTQTLTEAREAERLMTISVLHGAALPIERVDDRRIVLTEIEKLVQSMVGWRQRAAAAPGLPALVVPPRTAPEGWVDRNNIVHPLFSRPEMSDMFPWGSHFFVSALGYYADHLNKPKPLTAEDLERSWALCSSRTVSKGAS